MLCRKLSLSVLFVPQWAVPAEGSFATTRPDELAAVAVKGALDRVPALETKEIGDLMLGCAMPEGEQGWNFARTVVLRTGLPVEIGGVTVNRLCASGLEAVAQAAGRFSRGGLRQWWRAGRSR
jgi:acetyl-CoA acyltransferase